MKELIGIPEVVEQIHSAVAKLPKTIRFIDGEICSSKLTFNEISSIVSQKSEASSTEDQAKIKYYVFDYMAETPFTEREENLRKLMIENDSVERVKSFYFTPETLENLPIQKFIDEGYEGIMIRIPESTYQNKRSLGLFKHKLFEDFEAECTGFNAQENDDTKLGSIIFYDKERDQTFSARPALTDEKKQEIWDNRDGYIGQIATIKCQGFSEYDVPRFPVMKFWRDDWDIS